MADQRPRRRGERAKVYLILLATIAVMGLIFHATQTAMPKTFDLRLRDLTGEGAFGIGLLVSIVYGVAGLAQVCGGYLADRYPLKPIYVLGIALQIPVLAAVALLSGPSLVLLLICAAILSAAPAPAENMLIARFTPQRHQSLAFGAKFVVSFGIGPVALQLVSLVQAETGGFAWLFGLLAALALARHPGRAAAARRQARGGHVLPDSGPRPRPVRHRDQGQNRHRAGTTWTTWS